MPVEKYGSYISMILLKGGDYMLKEEQLIEMTWVSRNRKFYMNKGYNFTKIYDKFLVNVDDLPKSSDKYVDVICDHCGNIYKETYKHYNRKNKTDDCCKMCWNVKMQESMLQKYGKKHALQIDEFQHKFEETCLNKFGVKYPTQSTDVQQKRDATNIERYGCANVSQNAKIREKISNSFYQHGSCPTSKQQLYLFERLNDLYGQCELNYPCGNCMLDCAVFIDGFLIDVEYDGTYWHQDAIKDRKRDEFVKSQGYKIIRFVGKSKVPTDEQIIVAVNELLNTNKKFIKIELDI